MAYTTTTAEDVLADITKELKRIGAVCNHDGLEVFSTKDFTIVSVQDNQEEHLITIDTAINWFEALVKIESGDDGFEAAWQALTSIKNWETSYPE